jgi:hypothetical protein
MRLLKWRLNPTKSETPFPLPSAGSLAGGIFFGFFVEVGLTKMGGAPARGVLSIGNPGNLTK